MAIPYKESRRAGRYTRIAFTKLGHMKYIQLTLDRASGTLTLTGSGVGERELCREGRGPEEYINYVLKEYGDAVHAGHAQQLKHPENHNQTRPDFTENNQLVNRLRMEMGLKPKKEPIWQE